MNQAQKDYQKLVEISYHTRLLTGISHLLEWDQETYMPPGAATIRGEQLETLAGLIHTGKTSKKFYTALSKLVDIETGKVIAKGLTEAQIAALREWRRDYIKAKALPQKFVKAFAKLSSQSIVAWRNAKEKNDFNAFAPYLEKIIQMNRQKAKYIGYKDHPYDALLDDYEPGMTTKEITKVFTDLKGSIVLLLNEIKCLKQVDDKFIHGNFSHDKQIEFCTKILNDIGYGKEYGRLDFSAHPFSLAPHPTDSRITTRFHKTSLMSCISVVLHEAGHALYEMGLPKEEYGSPLGDAISLGIHESQSRWWETRIGQSKAFWKYHLPELKKTFKGQLDAVTLDQFYKAINKVEPSLIRVEADEVTYSLHVILRFELEKALIEGTLKVKDVPAAWNAKMKELLGITPKSNAEGCLQDIHWSMGAFWYFPTYTLGNLYAAQFFEAFEEELPNWEESAAKGEFLFIRKWLQDKVHKHGRRYTSLELIRKVTKKPFSAKPYVNYLRNKYKKIYNSSTIE